MKRGEEHPRSKLTEAMVIDARCYAAEGVLTTAEIIERLGADVSGCTMTWAINGRSWAHLNDAFPPPPRRPQGGVKGRKAKGPSKPRVGRRLDDDQVRGIRTARAARTTLQAVADQYGVSRTLVREIDHRRQYADIPDEAPS